MHDCSEEVTTVHAQLVRAGIDLPAEDLAPVADAVARHWRRMAPILSFEDWERDPALRQVVSPAPARPAAGEGAGVGR